MGGRSRESGTTTRLWGDAELEVLGQEAGGREEDLELGG